MQVIEAQPDMPIMGVVTLYSSLLKFTLHVHPDRLDYADQVLVYLLSTLLSHLHVLLFALIIFACRSTSMDLPIDINGLYIFDELYCICLLIEYFLLPCIHSFNQGACVKKLSGKGKIEDNKATKQIVALLSAPLEKYNDIVTALKLSNYPRVMEFLDNATNKVMATVIIQSIMKNRTQISTIDKVFDYLFFFIFPFIVAS